MTWPGHLLVSVAFPVKMVLHRNPTPPPESLTKAEWKGSPSSYIQLCSTGAKQEHTWLCPQSRDICSLQAAPSRTQNATSLSGLFVFVFPTKVHITYSWGAGKAPATLTPCDGLQSRGETEARNDMHAPLMYSSASKPADISLSNT